ncbi:class A beta-lactamase [Sandaracinobacter neustonicus]|nr:class A beta-lactamase [Sandaracinobacter neustonicus]
MANGLTRRSLMAGCGGFALGGMAPANLQALEAQAGGRLGFALLDTGTGKIIGHRMDERFGMCSTFKLPLAGLVLQAAERGELKLDTLLPITQADLVPHAPETGPNVGKAMRIRDLARVAQMTSDNVAANLLIKQLGGPAGVTKRLRALGDKATRLDRMEPEMNRVIGNDPRDTTTPRAMAETVARLLTNDALTPASRKLLGQWMADTQTGMRRLRAATPPGWTAGDKTGTGMTKGMPNRVNDVAIFWPPKGAPLVAAAFYEAPGHFPNSRPQDEAVLVQAMQIALPPSLQP